MKLLSAIAIAAFLSSGALPQACERKIGEDDGTASNGSGGSAQPAIPLPPPAYSATPLSQFLPDGGDDALSQARRYQANGQLWLARLLIEPRVSADDAKPEEVLLLAHICDDQEDDACVAGCNAKLPKGEQLAIKKRDGGRAPQVLPARPDTSTDFGRAQKLFLAGNAKDARAILEPKLLGNTASAEETRLLKEICKSQGDRMCVALCTSKLN